MRESVDSSVVLQHMVDAALHGNLTDVLNHGSEWLRVFLGADFALVASMEGGVVVESSWAGTADEETTLLPSLPFGRGVVVAQPDGSVVAMHDDARQRMSVKPAFVSSRFLGLPVFRGDVLSGMVYAARSMPTPPFSWREQLCVRALSECVAEVIDVVDATSGPRSLTTTLPDDAFRLTNALSSLVPFCEHDVLALIDGVRSEVSSVATVDAAHVYLPTPDGLVVPSDTWFESDPERFRRFKRATATRAFVDGVGLPGRVSGSNQSVWISSVVEDPNFPRVPDAVPVGIRSAVAFPVRKHDRIAAIVECFFTSDVEVDEELSRHVEEVSSQLLLA